MVDILGLILPTGVAMWSQLTTKQDYVAKLCPIIHIGLLKEVLIQQNSFQLHASGAHKI